MGRKKRTEIEYSAECQEALERLTALAHYLAAMLTGDPLSEETGLTATPRSQALAMGMMYFLIRLDPKDLYATFFAEKSLNQLPFTPFPAGYTKQAPLAALLGG